MRAQREAWLRRIRVAQGLAVAAGFGFAWAFVNEIEYLSTHSYRELTGVLTVLAGAGLVACVGGVLALGVAISALRDVLRRSRKEP